MPLPPARDGVVVPARTLLEVNSLAMVFGRDIAPLAIGRRRARALRAVDGVSLSISHGEALGLVGESGSGKSTLARCVVGLYQPTAGTIMFDGVDVTRSRSVAERRRIQMVFQDPYSSLNPRMTVGAALGEVIRVHRRIAPGRIRARCHELLDLVGLSAAVLHAYPRQLSGGQRQRVSIARALALDPDLLVADEPVSALDVSVQATILNVFLDLRRRLGVSLLLIAHDLSVVRHVCDRVAVMYLGRVVEQADTASLFSDPRHPYTQALLASIPRMTARRIPEQMRIRGDPPSPYDIPVGCRFRTRCSLAQRLCLETEPTLLGGTPAHVAACHFAWSADGLETGRAGAGSRPDSISAAAPERQRRT